MWRLAQECAAEIDNDDTSVNCNSMSGVFVGVLLPDTLGFALDDPTRQGALPK
jgi:hypothetical protein